MVICNTTSLRWSVHAFADFGIDGTLVDKIIEVVQFHNLVRDHSEGNVHIFVSFHQCHKVKVFKINCHEAGVRGGQNTVDENFHCCNISGFSADITRIFNKVASSCPSDLTWLWFLGAVSAYHLNVHCLTIFHDLVKWNEEYGVSTPWHMAIRTKALG